MKNDLFEIQVLGRAEGLWRYRQAAMDHAYNIAAPTFEVDGKEVRAVLVAVAMVGGPVRLSNGCTEHAYEGVLADDPGLALQIIFRTADGDPVVRFRYVLRSTALGASRGRPAATRWSTWRSAWGTCRRPRRCDSASSRNSCTVFACRNFRSSRASSRTGCA